MKISVARARPVKGDIDSNIKRHKRVIDFAGLSKADAIFFPELSVTGYEPSLAQKLATNQDDEKFDEIQKVSDESKIMIGIGIGNLVGQLYVGPNVVLNGLLFERKENKLLMIYFQGNAKNLQNFLDMHNMVLDWGYNVLVTDYRSFGKSTGQLTGEKQIYADADKLYDYAIRLGYAPENIIIYGYSMGTSSAVYLASARPSKAVILESPFSSMPEVSWAADKVPSFEMNSAERARRITVPTLIIHGDQDDVITPDHSKRIFANLGTDKKQLIMVKNGGHGDLKGRTEYSSYISDFIKLCMPR